MASDSTADPQNPTPQKIRVNDDGSHTPYIALDPTSGVMDSNGNLKTSLATSIAGEDIPNDVLKVEQRFGSQRFTADGSFKIGVGVIKELVISQPASATPTAGVLTIYDSNTESGTVLFQHYFPASAIPAPITIALDCSYSVGVYVGFDATLAGIAVNVIGR